MHTILLLKLGCGLVPNCEGSIVNVQKAPAQWLRTRYTFFLNAQHMIDFVRSTKLFCLHSLEVVRKLLVQGSIVNAQHNADNVRLFMDQEPSFQVAKFVYGVSEVGGM